MKYIINWVTGLKWSTIIIIVAILGIGSFVFLRNGGGNENQTLIVKKGDFVKQVFVSGNVRATNNVDLGFAQSGRVSGVYVKVGDTVVQGKVLAEIENGDVRAAVLQKQASVENERAVLASLEQGTRPEELAVTKSEVAKNEAALLQTHQDMVDTIRDAYATADDAVRNQIDQFVNNPRSISPQINFIVSDSSLENRIEFKRTSIEPTLVLWQSEIFTLTAEGDLNKAQTEARNNLSSVASLLADANSALNQAVGDQTTFNAWIADVALARSAVNSAISALTTAVTAEKNAQSELDISKKNLELSLAGSTVVSVDAQKAKVRSAEADVLSARSQLLKTLIVAPFSGIVTKAQSKVGAVASANTSEISMISVGGFEIESFIPEVDIAEVKVGDSAQVTLDAYGSSVFFEALVSSVEPAETVRDGVSTYKTILRFTKQDSRIKSGMTANVVITTESKTGVIAIPQNIVVFRDGKKVVFVRKDGVDSIREVETGKVSSLGDIEIISGLSVGDEVVLAPESK